MTLSSPVDADQVRDSLLRFVQERVRLELLTSLHAPDDGRVTSHVEITHGAPDMQTRGREPQARPASAFPSPSLPTAEGVRASG